MHAARGRPAQMRMRAWPGLCYVRSGWAIDAVHAHRHQRRASRASRDDAHVHACPGPQRAQTPSIGAHSACRPVLTRRLCCATPPACSPGSIRLARSSHSTLYTHGQGEECGTCSGTRSRVSTRATEGPGSGRGWGRTGAAGRRGMGACSLLSGGSWRRRRAAPRGAALCMVRRSGGVGAQQDKRWRGCARGRRGRLRAPGTGRVDGALSGVALVQERCRPRAAPARRVE